MAIYLLKVNLAMMLLYGFYRLMTNRDTFFALRRATLWAIYIIALTIPFLNIEYWIKDSDTTVSMANSYAKSILPTMMTYANGPSVTWKDFISSNAAHSGSGLMKIIELNKEKIK